MAKWIHIGERTPSKTGKTSIWQVWSINGDGHLGEVRWFGRWRKYAFFPDHHTLYEQQCLRDLAAFCEQQTAAHRSPSSGDRSE